MELTLLYRTDVWFSHASKELIGVFSSVEKAIDGALIDASYALLFDNDREIEIFEEEFEENQQVTIKDTGYIIFPADLDLLI